MNIMSHAVSLEAIRRVHPPTAHTPIPPKPKFNFNINLLIINIILYFVKF